MSTTFVRSKMMQNRTDVNNAPSRSKQTNSNATCVYASPTPMEYGSPDPDSSIVLKAPYSLSEGGVDSDDGCGGGHTPSVSDCCSVGGGTGSAPPDSGKYHHHDQIGSHPHGANNNYYCPSTGTLIIVQPSSYGAATGTAPAYYQPASAYEYGYYYPPSYPPQYYDVPHTYQEESIYYDLQQTTLSYNPASHHAKALSGSVSFTPFPRTFFSPPSVAPGFFPGRSVKATMTRLFFGQLPYDIQENQLQWIVTHVTIGAASVYGMERIVQWSKNRMPSGCVHVYCLTHLTETICEAMNNRLLIDDSGIWIATSEAELMHMNEYCKKMKVCKELRPFNRPYQMTAVEIANSSFRAKERTSKRFNAKHLPHVHRIPDSVTISTSADVSHVW